MDTNTIIILLSIGLVAGFISGLVGVGGGVIIVPALVYFIGMSQASAQGTSLALFCIPISFALAAYNYHQTGNINWTYSLIMLVTFVAGGFLGSKLAVNIDQNIVKKIFGVFLLLVAIKLISGK